MMICPKCKGDMQPVEFGGVRVHRCNGCGGLWFGMLVHEDLKRIQGSEAIDTGDPEVGKAFEELALVRCPVDDVRMIRMVDSSQPHIWFESCPVCYGTFFDAGEFRDFKEHSLVEFLRARRRPRPL
jgi:Zn-finger nucleic acid-binding protein